MIYVLLSSLSRWFFYWWLISVDFLFWLWWRVILRVTSGRSQETFLNSLSGSVVYGVKVASRCFINTSVSCSSDVAQLHCESTKGGKWGLGHIKFLLPSFQIVLSVNNQLPTYSKKYCISLFFAFLYYLVVLHLHHFLTTCTIIYLRYYDYIVTWASHIFF